MAGLGGAPAPADEAALEEYLSRPVPGTMRTLGSLEGDLLVLGAGGKMGLSLCRMARRSLDAAGARDRKVIAVSRFGDPAARRPFEDAGIEARSLDLLVDGAVEALPDTPNVLFLVGMKFGSTGAPATTWAMNTFLPGLIARRFAGPQRRIVALSTGNVYGLTSVRLGGSIESDVPAPAGEYAQSCLGRERMFGYYSEQRGTPATMIRLNYANDLRYGVLVDIAQQVLAEQPVDVSMGSVNVIWQGDANAAILQAFGICESPPAVLNVTGPETISVRRAAHQLAGLLDAPPPLFAGEETDSAILSNAGRQHALFGYPSVPANRLMAWTAAWLRRGGRTLGKPTQFGSRDGSF